MLHLAVGKKDYKGYFPNFFGNISWTTWKDPNDPDLIIIYFYDGPLTWTNRTINKNLCIIFNIDREDSLEESPNAIVTNYSFDRYLVFEFDITIKLKDLVGKNLSQMIEMSKHHIIDEYRTCYKGLSLQECSELKHDCESALFGWEMKYQNLPEEFRPKEDWIPVAK